MRTMSRYLNLMISVQARVAAKLDQVLNELSQLARSERRRSSRKFRSTPPTIALEGRLYLTGITITQGGTYSGYWETTNPNESPVIIATSEPVTIVNSVIIGNTAAGGNNYGNTGLIEGQGAGFFGLNLTVRNSQLIGNSPGGLDQTQARAIRLINPKYLQFDHNDVTGTTGIEVFGYADDVASFKPADQLRITNNLFTNIDGRITDGNGGFKSENSLGANAVQFNYVRNQPNVEIGWNKIVNTAGSSAQEDVINMLNSEGTSTSSISIHDNYIGGQYSANPEAKYSTGSGINVVDNTDPIISGYVNVNGNVITGTQADAIDLNGGHDVNVYENVIVNTGRLPNGNRLASVSTGIRSWNYYGWNSSLFFNNSVFSNSVDSQQVNTDGTTIRSDFESYQPGTTRVFVSGDGNNLGISGANGFGNYSRYPGQTLTLSQETIAYNEWAQRVTNAGLTIGDPNPGGNSYHTLLENRSPTSLNVTDNVGYELGMKFQSSTAGQITGIRFFKSQSESGTHTGTLWSSTGTKLATVTFTNETVAGWQTAYLSVPVTIAANTQYVVTVNTGNNYFVSQVGGLASTISRGNLSTVGAGLFGTVGSLPSGSYQNSNYFRDVVFVPNSSLPTGWSNSNIGSPGQSGSSTQNSGEWIVTGGGTDIAGTSDSFNFANTSYAGSGAVIAKVESIQNTNATAKAGVMFRASTAANAVEASVVVTPSGTIVFQRRTAAGGTIATTQVTGQTAPKWVRLTRSGSNFSAHYSNDGNTWTQIGTTQAITAMSSTALVGLAVTARNNASLTAGRFTNVSVQSSIFTSQVPANTNASDGTSYEQGTVFQSSVDGYVTGIRFYRATGETGTNIGRLWDSTGKQLASATFTATGSGWVTVTFSKPVYIRANTQYTVSVSINSRFAVSSGGLNSAVSNGRLTTVGGGVFGTIGTRPTTTFNNSNYFVDPFFASV